MPGLRSIEVRLHTADLARSIAFYRDLLGFAVDTLFPERSPSFAILTHGGVRLQIGAIDTHQTPAAAPTCTLWLDVEGVLGWHEAISHKCPVEWGPEVYFYGRREFAVRDPDGRLVILSEVTDDPVTCQH